MEAQWTCCNLHVGWYIDILLNRQPCFLGASDLKKYNTHDHVTMLDIDTQKSKYGKNLRFILILDIFDIFV